MANRVGVEDEMHYRGGSRVVDPFGNSVAMLQTIHAGGRHVNPEWKTSAGKDDK